MSSRREQREQARAERLAREREIESREQRGRRLWQLGAAAVLAAVVVAAAVAISRSGSEPTSSEAGGLAAEARAVEALFADIPQDGVFLGDPDAPVTMIEFVDLQCPFCARYSADVLPTVIERYVRPGRVRLELRALAFIGPDSERAARVAAAAAQQDRMWQFVELFFRGQGTENSGFATDEFLSRLAQATPSLDARRALAERRSPATSRLLAEARRRAERAGVDSTPSFLLSARGDTPRRLEVPSLRPEAFADALDEALRGQ